MRKLIHTIPLLSWLMLVPKFAKAQISDLTLLVEEIANLVGISLVVLLGGWIFVRFLLNIADMLRSSGDTQKRADLKNRLLWNIVILFVFVAIWGIITQLSVWTGIGAGGTGTIPGIIVNNGS